MSKKNNSTKTPILVSISIRTAKFIGETAGVATEIKECSKIQYKHSYKTALAASKARIKAFTPLS